MKAIIVSIATICLLSEWAAAASTIFDDDHDFMKGFETGVMMRTSDSSVEEFGCKMPQVNW